MGKERLEEIADPEIAMQRAINTYRQKGYSEGWITQRMRSIGPQKELTAELQNMVETLQEMQGKSLKQ